MRKDVYETVTNKIVAQLEAGILPWIRPWDSVKGNVAIPHNAVSGRAYSGINPLLLWCSPYASQGWLTFNQAKQLGGHVLEGAKATEIYYANRFLPKAEKDKGPDGRFAFMLKPYWVFNVEQCAGLNLPTVEPVARDPASIVAAADDLASRSGARITFNNGNRACYIPSIDLIEMPPQTCFKDQINYYRTLFHELGHWTGHASRLNRDLNNRFGGESYAAEELIAEIGAAYTCAALGIEPTVRHADYIGSWLRVLKNDKRAIFDASRHASKAADFLLGDSGEELAIAA